MSEIPEWADTCVKLLQGPIYNEKNSEKSWSNLVVWQQHISEYFSIMNLKLVIDAADGYAFLSQNETEDEIEKQPSRLMKKVPLTFETSLLCVLLREALENFDASQIESPMLIMTSSEIRELLTAFYKNRSDETKLYRELELHLSRVEDLGFLKQLPLRENQTEAEYEVRRIIRAKINMEFISEFKEKLESYDDAE